MADATRPSTALGDGGSRDAAAAEQIVAHVCAMIERGALRPGGPGQPSHDHGAERDSQEPESGHGAPSFAPSSVD